MIKCRHLSANHLDFPSNQYRDRQKQSQISGHHLVRITHIMLKKRFYLTNSYSSDILALLIRIEDSQSTREGGRHREPSEILGEDWECPVRYCE